MIPIIKREINSFFSSAIGYLVIAVYLVINGLFLWVFGGNFNILDSGFADLSPYFELAPWVLLFLVPAVSMRAFSDELRMGTLELLLTKPLSLKQIVLGKYFGAVILIIIALVPTLDRKSTRLNSSHVRISYAVFCLKKKTQPVKQRHT